jgi:NAD(P)-dependent dehydrogenase (short-subunit alcohol dehydrogenase family)
MPVPRAVCEVTSINPQKATMKTVLITGAASGIGLESAHHFLHKGWRVIAVDRAPDGLAGLRNSFAEIPAERLITATCDVTSAPSVTEAFSNALGAAGDLDALVCCAGVLRTGAVAEMSEDDYDTLFNVNTKGPWLCMKAALPALRRAAGANKTARVVMISSISAIRPKAGSGIYAASKVALSQMVRVMAVECASEQILVNAIAPGTVNTPFIQGALAGTDRRGGFKLSGAAPLGRVSDPGDIVSVIDFLLSDASRFVTGVTLPVDGGTSAAVISQQATQ